MVLGGVGSSWGDSLSDTPLVVNGVKKGDQFAGGKLTCFKTDSGKLSDDVITSRIQGHRGLFFDILQVKRWFLWAFGQRIESGFGDTKFDGRK